MTEANPNTRLEAFCDGVFAIAITLLIIEIKIPEGIEINSQAEFWNQLKHLTPLILAFVLSFVVILITWVNHHAALKLVNKSAPSFTYANGFLLLTVVIVPFPTALLGEYILTAYASQVVFIYNAVIAIQGIAWILISASAIKNKLAKSDHAIMLLKKNKKNGYYAFSMYGVLAILALWFPLSVAVISALTWVFWLIYGINLKHE